MTEVGTSKRLIFNDDVTSGGENQKLKRGRGNRKKEGEREWKEREGEGMEGKRVREIEGVEMVDKKNVEERRQILKFKK